MSGRNAIKPIQDHVHDRFTSQGSPDAAGTGSLVLVVDDEAYINLLITSILKLHGCSVLSATDGEHALSVLAEHPRIAVVVTDLHMPTLDGFGLMAALGASHPELPVVVVTARGAESDQRRSVELGARALLTKPFSRQQLWNAVAPLLGMADST